MGCEEDRKIAELELNAYVKILMKTTKKLSNF
jgi:hypothetical protein